MCYILNYCTYHTMAIDDSIEYRIVITLAVKSLTNKDCRKFHRKIFGKLKCICIENVTEIVKIDKKTW